MSNTKKTVYFVLPANEYDLIVSEEKEFFTQSLDNPALVELLKRKLHERDCNTSAFIRWYKKNYSKPITIKISKKTQKEVSFANCKAIFKIEENKIFFHIKTIISTKNVSI